LQSLDFAHDTAMAGQPLDIWHASQVVSPESVDKTEDFFKRLYSCFKLGRGAGPEERVHAFLDQQPLRYQQLRLDVLRAFSFVDTYKEDQDRWRNDFGEGRGEVTTAFRIVRTACETSLVKDGAKLPRRSVLS
jgi:hypothetical protein